MRRRNDVLPLCQFAKYGVWSQCFCKLLKASRDRDRSADDLSRQYRDFGAHLLSCNEKKLLGTLSLLSKKARLFDKLAPAIGDIADGRYLRINMRSL